jgi:hypothetical protein
VKEGEEAIMAIVSACAYDAQGQLVRPGRREIGRAKISLDLESGGSPTFERGRVHVYTVTASGLTADHARERVNAQLERFFERAEDVTGYREIARNETQGVTPCNHNVTITYEFLYAVEAPKWARGHRLESRYRRDIGAVAHG